MAKKFVLAINYSDDELRVVGQNTLFLKPGGVVWATFFGGPEIVDVTVRFADGESKIITSTTIKAKGDDDGE